MMPVISLDKNQVKIYHNNNIKYVASLALEEDVNSFLKKEKKKEGDINII